MPIQKGIASRLTGASTVSAHTANPTLKNINIGVIWSQWQTGKNTWSSTVENNITASFNDAHTYGYNIFVRLFAGVDSPVGDPDDATADWMSDSWPAGSSLNDFKPVRRLRVWDSDSSSPTLYNNERYQPDFITPDSYANYREWYNVAIARLLTILNGNDSGGHPRINHCTGISCSLPTENGTEMNIGYGTDGPTGYTGTATLGATASKGATSLTLAGTFGTYPTGPALLRLRKHDGTFELVHQASRSGATVTVAKRGHSGSDQTPQYESVPTPVNVTVTPATTTAKYNHASPAANTVFNATAWTSTAIGATAPEAVEIGATVAAIRAVWNGGLIIGSIDPALDWTASKAYGGTGIRIYADGPWVAQYVRIHNAGDGFKPRETPFPSTNARFTIRHCYLTAIRDDCIENDDFTQGEVLDCLFDGVWTFFSEQNQGPTGAEPWKDSVSPGEDNRIYIRDCIIRLHPANGPETNPGKFFKWQPGAGLEFGATGDPTELHRPVIRNTIFATNAAPKNGWGSGGWPDDTVWEGNENYICWLSDAAYTGPMPGDPSVDASVHLLTGAAARTFYKQKRNDWLTRHGLASQTMAADYNPFTAPTVRLPTPTDATTVYVEYANAVITDGVYDGYPTGSTLTNQVGGMTASATSVTVDSTAMFPVAPFLVMIDDETISVGAKTATVLSSLTRGVNGTTAATHSDNDNVKQVAPYDHEHLNQFVWSTGPEGLANQETIVAQTEQAWIDNVDDMAAALPASIFVGLAGGGLWRDNFLAADRLIESVGPTIGARILGTVTNLQNGYNYTTTHANERAWLQRVKDFGGKIMIQTASVSSIPNTAAGLQELIDSFEWAATAPLHADIIETGSSRFSLTGSFSSTASGTLGGGWLGGSVSQVAYMISATRNIQSRMVAATTNFTKSDNATAAESSSVVKPAAATAKSASDAGVATETASAASVFVPIGGNWFDPAQYIPTYEVQVTYLSSIPAEVATRTLNTATNPGNRVADTIEFSDVMPGGFSTFSCFIPNAEYITIDGQKAYRFMATLTVRIGVGWPGAGTILFQGYLKTPVPQPDGRVQLQANGWMKLLEERDEDLLFVDESYGSWQTADSDPWGEPYTKGDAINAEVKTGCLRFKVEKNQDIRGLQANNPDQARIGWFFDGHAPTRIEFDLVQSSVVPNAQDQASPAFDLRLEKSDGPAAFGTLQEVFTFTASLNDKATDRIDRDLSTGGKPAILFALRALRDADEFKAAFMLQIRDVRVYELATTYNFDGWDVMNVLAARVGGIMGAKTSKLLPDGSGIPGLMPLWWQAGSWMELADYVGTAYAFKVAFWEGTGTDAHGPIDIEYRSWLGATTWKVDAYSAAAFANPEIYASDDVYTQIEVTYKVKGSQRLRRQKSPVLVNGVSPFAGLPKNRQRTYRFQLQDSQKDGVLAKKIADILAQEYGAEQLSGTLTLSYVLDTAGTNKISATRVRSGDQVMIRDFPGDPNSVFRVYETTKTETQVTLQIGRIPTRVERLLFWDHRRLMRTGRISSSPD